MGGVEGRAERRMGGEIMRGGRNGEYDGSFWRGEMTGWSKDLRGVGRIMLRQENGRSSGRGNGNSSWAPTIDSRRRAHTSTE
jgi:hypothetical protein